MAAVMAGDGNGSCEGRQRQAKAAAAMAAATAGDSSCDIGRDSGQRQLRRRVMAPSSTGGDIHFNDGRRPLGWRVTAALKWWQHRDSAASNAAITTTIASASLPPFPTPQASFDSSCPRPPHAKLQGSLPYPQKITIPPPCHHNHNPPRPVLSTPTFIPQHIAQSPTLVG